MNKAIILRIIFFGFVIFSVFTIYYTMVIEKNYTTFTNPDGPDTSDYFLFDAKYEGDS
jgi:hypothetical protein